MTKMFRVCSFVNIISHKFKRNYSALYVTGEKATQNFAVLTPYIDFEERIRDKKALALNVSARHLPISVEKIEKKWQFFKVLDDRLQKLQETKTVISQSITNLIKTNNSTQHSEEIDKLKLHLKIVKDDLRNLKESYYEVEEDTMLKILSLPNILNSRTPLEEKEVCHVFLDKLNGVSDSHMTIGMEADLIEYINPFNYFFKSEAALFELSALNYALDFFDKSGYVLFSNANFCRSVIAEGCGDTVDQSSKLITIEEHENSGSHLNRLHLCGSSTLYSFMAYFARHTVQPTYFPLKYFSVGKNYRKVPDSHPEDLFNLAQESSVNIFLATTDKDDLLESVISQLKVFYESLGYHFRIILVPANELESAESLRVAVEMYSYSLGTYVEVANVSLYENFVSKRLLFSYSVEKERKFPKVISGTLLNVPKLLGCVLENNFITKNNLLSDTMKQFMFK